MQHNQNIFESLFNRSFSDTNNIAYLNDLAERHPYFSPAQFFLLEKLQADPAAFEKQAVKTSIFFNNPHWLHFQVNETGLGEAKTIINESDVVAHVTPTVDEPATPPEATIITTELETAEARATEINDLPDDTDERSPDSYRDEKEIEPMHIQLKMPVQNAALEETMLFEPMHLVDYFASQGIKLNEEVQTADKLGKQLKSFTDWLKTMKKIHVENEGENPVKPDVNVQVLAENSNTETEVVTESMAEVFAQQGKIEKAGEVYLKLSLLNPAKSTYFAAKLENLKGL